ncbi:GtrA family protein [Dactylosporangium maewongense]|uniref:GtrA family protein n=1 Tax=Dactylosporangium maewongense TaxID=634393 RepID=UPI0031D8F9E9
MRWFTGPVPLRSRVGNALTRVCFAAVTGSRVQDTQTGSSMLAGAVDAAVLFALHAATGALLPSVLTARAVSSTTNFAVNRRLVFGGGRSSLPVAARRYWTLVAVLAVANYLVLATLVRAGLPLLPAKVATEAGLFAVSYVTQQRFVFGSRGTAPSQVAHRPARLDERTTN